MVRSLTHDQKLTVTQHRKYDQRLSLNSVSVSGNTIKYFRNTHLSVCTAVFNPTSVRVLQFFSARLHDRGTEAHSPA